VDQRRAGMLVAWFTLFVAVAVVAFAIGILIAVLV
jgi:hypothetical protein